MSVKNYFERAEKIFIRELRELVLGSETGPPS